ncbi:MAG: hypothetical protein GX595_06805 [Lentisphaerae bacterium]|nr:hypothetical protein [Lentisphaerota bacterium]
MARYRDDDYSQFPAYIPVAEKRAQNEKAAARLRRQNADAQPVVIAGRSIATQWWGKSWNSNLERYADYSNRIGRGRSYVRNGAVIDLRITPGQVTALVQGSMRNPYKITITIEALPAATWKALREASLRQVESLGDLLAGKFPQALKDVFFAQGTGLFPTPREIAFDCSCPDWASMCKHVAAALYGVGNRLDASPELLFTLRKVTMDDLITHTLDTATKGLVSKADQATGDDILAAADLGAMFGIDLDAPGAAGGKAKASPKPAGQAAAAARRAAPAEPERADRSGKADREARPKRPAAKGKPAPKPAGRAAKAPAKASPKPAGRAANAPAKATPKRPAATGRRPADDTIMMPLPPKRGTRPNAIGAPQAGRMTAQLVEAVRTLRGQFTTDDVVRLLPEWTRLQVTNTLQRALREGSVRRLRQGVYGPA